MSRVEVNGKETVLPNGDPRVVLASGTTIEVATTTILRYMMKWKDEGCLSVHVWDSISVSQPAGELKEVEEALKEGRDINIYSGGISLRARILGPHLNSILNKMWGVPAAVFLINQARAKISKYGSGGEESSGGYNFKHNIHYTIKFKYLKPFERNIGAFKSGTVSQMTVEKSKFTPKVLEIPIYIRDDKGGLIDPSEELLSFCLTNGYLGANKGWHSFTEASRPFLPDESLLEKKYHGFAKVLEACQEGDLRQHLLAMCEKYVRSNFFLVDIAYKLKEEALSE